MIITNASFKLIECADPIKKIEQIARVCYKSEDKIGEGTDIKMVSNLINRKHTAMLEHASMCFAVGKEMYAQMQKHVNIAYTVKTPLTPIQTQPRNYLRFSHFKNSDDRLVDRYLISGNLRAWYDTINQLIVKTGWAPYWITKKITEHTKNLMTFDLPEWLDISEQRTSDWDVHKLDTYKDLTPQERLIHEDLSVMFTTDRGVTHEMVRMRDCSFAQESTRYCNYSNGKFGNEITVIKPCFFEEDSVKYRIWKNGCEQAENAYFELIKEEAIPQEARSVLPNSLKAEITMTTNLNEWRHILALRACDSTGPAHPQIKEVMVPLLEKLQKSKIYGKLFADLEIKK